jgi:hypothetical protein
MKVPVDTLVCLPDALSFETGAAISCGTGTAYGALKRLNLQGGETIAIFGQGPRMPQNHRHVVLCLVQEPDVEVPSSEHRPFR